MADYSELASIGGPMGKSPVWTANADTGIFEGWLTVECDWADRVAVYNSIIWTEWPHTVNTNAYAIEGRCEGWGKSSDAGSGLIAYEKARIRFYYNNKIENVGGFWITESFQPSTEFHPLDAREFCWVDNEPQPDGSGVQCRDHEAPSMRQVFADYILTYHRVLLIPDAALSHIGCCNHATVGSYTLNKSFPAETLTLVAAPATRSLYNSWSLRAWKLTYHFRYTPHGANKFWRADTEAWENLYRIEDTDRYIQHPLVNFTQLIP